MAIHDVPGGVVRDAFEHIFPRAVAPSEGYERMSGVVHSPARNADGRAVVLQAFVSQLRF
jgi:hypothetical protein